MAFPPPENLPFSKEDDDVVDVLGVHPFKPTERRQPKSKTDLIEAVAHSSKVKRELRALGSAWSLSAATEAADIVDTLYLRNHLSPPHGGSILGPERVMGTEHAKDIRGTGYESASDVAGRKFVHVEAGIKTAKLLEDLKSCGLALPTMGAGGGQSLAGALSTGTHGADFMVPPLVEWVRAVHLVGPLGQEWWITPANSIFTGVEVLQLPGWPTTGEILANDDAFNAIRVAVGRMGVIYSLILEVVEPYTLLEITHQGANSTVFSNPVQRISYHGQVFADQGGVSEGQVFTNTGLGKNSWPTVREQLSNSGIVDGNPFGIFDTPITDFSTGWLQQEVIEPTVAAIIEAFKGRASAAGIAIDPIGRSLADEFYLDLTSQQRAQLDGAALPIFGSGDLRSTFDGLELTNFVVQRMGLEQLAAGLRGSSVKPLRHLNIVVSLATPDVCWITRRWALPGVTPTANLGRMELDPDSLSKVLKDSLEHYPQDPMPILTKISNKIVDGITGAIHSRSVEFLPLGFAFDPMLGMGSAATIGVVGVGILSRVERFISREVARINQAVTAARGTSGEALFLFMYRAATDPDVQDVLGSPIRLSVSGIIGSSAFVNPARAGESNDVLDTHNYELDYTGSLDSAEYLFDASGNDYLAFIDAILDLTGPRPGTVFQPVFGYMGIRFTPKASALIAMQRYELTASVEVGTGRARTDPVYTKFWATVHEAARTHGGIPHWGQEFPSADHVGSADYVAAHYGEDLTRWRQVLTELSVDDPGVFSTAFTRDLGLEPSGSAGLLRYDALTAFLTALEGASDS